MPGIAKSKSTKSGCNSKAVLIASVPSAASPQIRICVLPRRKARRAYRMLGLSSTIRTVFTTIPPARQFCVGIHREGDTVTTLVLGRDDLGSVNIELAALLQRLLRT